MKKPSWLVVIIVGGLCSGIILMGFTVLLLWQYIPAISSSVATNINSGIQVTTNFDDVDFTDSATLDDSDIVAPTEAVTYAANNWITFTGRKLPLRFSYPGTWQLFEGSTPLSKDIQLGDYDSTVVPATDSVVPPGHKIEITMFPNPTAGTSTSIATWLKQGDKDYFGKAGDISTITVDSFPATLDTMNLKYAVGQVVIIPLGDGTGRLISLSLYGPEKDVTQARGLLDSILATVHFIEL